MSENGVRDVSSCKSSAEAQSDQVDQFRGVRPDNERPQNLARAGVGDNHPEALRLTFDQGFGAGGKVVAVDARLVSLILRLRFR